MPNNVFTRFSGFVVLLAGGLTILFNTMLWTQLIPRTLEYPGYLGLQILFIFTLIAILILHIQNPGVLLVVGFVMSLVSLIIDAGFSYYATFAFPILQAQFPDAVSAVLDGPVGSLGIVSMGLGLVGNLLFYFAVIQAGLVPRWITVVLILATLLTLAMLPYNLSVILSGFGLIAMGFYLLSKKAEFAPGLEPKAVT
jgi:hypothetical protein